MPQTPDTILPPAGPPAEDIAPAMTLSERAAGVADLVREHPRTAIAAGAALAVGVAAAAAIPLARARRANGGGESATKTPPKTPARRRTATKKKA